MLRTKGFTLIELMLVIALIGVFTALALPSYQASVRSSTREESAISLVNALALARSEAVSRGVQVSVAPNVAADNPPGNGFYRGGVWSVVVENGTPAFPGDPSPVIEVFQASTVDRVFSAGVADVNTRFVFNPNGTLNQTMALNFCFNGGSSCSQVRINLVGRAQIAQVDNP